MLERLRLSPSARMVYPASPFTDGQLQQIVWSDIYGQAIIGPLSRTEAMTVPAMNKARNLLATTVGRLPLSAWNKEGQLPLEEQPSWLYRTDGVVGPYQRMLWTVDDLLFYGHSLWQVVRGSDAVILSAERVPMEWWKVSNEGAILIDDEPVNARDVIYFPSHTDPLLEVGASTLRAARNVEKSVERRASSPVPVMEIHHLDADTPVDATEAKEMVVGYNSARRDAEGATVFTPAHIELRPHGDKADAGAMIEARNAVRLDIANLTNIPASLLDGSVATASLTYVTTQGKKSEFIEQSLVPWIETIQGRLSMDDVVPRGQRVRFIMDELLSVEAVPTGSAETRD